MFLGFLCAPADSKLNNQYEIKVQILGHHFKGFYKKFAYTVCPNIVIILKVPPFFQKFKINGTT